MAYQKQQAINKYRQNQERLQQKEEANKLAIHLKNRKILAKSIKKAINYGINHGEPFMAITRLSKKEWIIFTIQELLEFDSTDYVLYVKLPKYEYELPAADLAVNLFDQAEVSTDWVPLNSLTHLLTKKVRI